MRAAYEKNGIRPVKITPVELGLKSEEIKKLEELGYSKESTLMSIIDEHEKASLEILEKNGFENGQAFSYRDAYDKGYEDGYEEGYDIGFDLGYDFAKGEDEKKLD